ncbi:MAG: class D sortase [Saccharofermentans sp.]|nr:class D sortase [Saccharofermentans sp.]
MKRIDAHKGSKRTKKIINSGLLAISILLLVAGIILLLIEPIKRFNRKKISEEARVAISEKIEESDQAQMTFVVPATGNEVAGEEDGYDVMDEPDEDEDTVFEEEMVDKVTLNSIGILTIDKINISYSVWDVATKVSLRYGLGHYPASAMPGEAGNATILGHNYKDGTMFHNLGKLSKGDKVVFQSIDGTETVFEVKESKIIKATDLYKYVKSDVSKSSQLTLVTCTYEYGNKGWRRIVICKPV